MEKNEEVKKAVNLESKNEEAIQENKQMKKVKEKSKIPIIDKTKNPETAFNQYFKSKTPLTKKISINLKISRLNSIYSISIENITEMDDSKVNKLLMLNYNYLKKKGYNVRIFDSIG